MTRFALAAALWALVLGVAGAPARAADAVSFPVSFETEDGFTLHGELTSAASTESPVAILLHMYRHDRSSWEPLVPELVANGITVLALDQRTHGQSTRQVTKQGDVTRRVNDISREAFGDVVRAGPKDVAAARAYLLKQGFDASRIALVGASYGCSVALLSADLEGVKALVLLSPGTAYFGVDVTEIARTSLLPLLAVAAEDDANAARAARSLSDGRRATSELKIYETGGHGTRLFEPHPKLVVGIREFLRQNFGMAPPG
jgi:pimeloyl-ACP methyl ester carboxylesterase